MRAESRKAECLFQAPSRERNHRLPARVAYEFVAHLVFLARVGYLLPQPMHSGESSGFKSNSTYEAVLLVSGGSPGSFEISNRKQSHCPEHLFGNFQLFDAVANFLPRSFLKESEFSVVTACGLLPSLLEPEPPVLQKALRRDCFRSSSTPCPDISVATPAHFWQGSWSRVAPSRRIRAGGHFVLPSDCPKDSTSRI